MRAIDPIFFTPRLTPREWGRRDLGEWCKGRARPSEPIGEVWLQDAANATEAGPLGRRLACGSAAMLGDVGRAPPRMRLVFPDQAISIPSTSPVSLWTVLEPGAAVADSSEIAHRTGERIRAYEGAAVTFPQGCVALEVSASFQPRNEPDAGPSTTRLPPVSRRTRASLLRDEALSVELWTLPEWSRLAPDGETCHVVTALTPGATLDGRPLQPGAAVFVPAWGRALDLTGAGVRVVVAYPDQTPTAIWRHAPGPDPAAGQLPLPTPVCPRATAAAGSALQIAA